MIMLRKIIFLVISGFITFNVNAEWIPVTKNNTIKSKTLPKIQILSDNENSTIVDIEIYGFDLNEINANGKTYHSIDLLTEMHSTQEGYPELPYISKILAIPDNASISYEILKIDEVQTFKDIHLKPAQKSQFEGMPEFEIKEDFNVYHSLNVFPENQVKLEKPDIFRDFRITRLSVFPVRYIPVKNELQVVSKMTVKINYGQDETENIKTSSKKAIAPSFGKLYRGFISNYQQVLDRDFDGKEAGHDLMLCIMPDVFVTNFTPYAEWKRKSGIDIHITKFSDIGANSSNPAIIKNHITDAYLNWEVPPTYVLIIGDDGVFPKEIVTLDGWSFPNEDFFVEVEGNDFFPEMMIGRFTNQEDYRMRVMLNKFTLYETTPYTADIEWFKKGTCCSNNAHISQVETKQFTADLMLTDGNFISVDELMSSEPCTSDNNDVINAVNNGRSYLNYRGEGWSYGWGAYCTPLQTSDLSQINNGEKFTFVTSIGCGVAMFDESGGNCFGEEWVEMGTLTNPRGGIAFIGPTSNTHTTYNNKIDKGIYVGMFQEGMDTPGQGLLRGKLYLYNVYGTDPYVEYHYKIYCVLGDPSIHVWKDVPLSITVENEVNNNIVTVTVNHELSGLPVDSAQVTITGESFFSSSYTDVAGIANIDLGATALSEVLTLTVRGGNVIPSSEILEIENDVEYNKKLNSSLKQNIPNPFTTNTFINYSVEKSEYVSLNIYNLKGQIVRTLQNGNQTQGNYSLEWNGLNDKGDKVVPGIYYYCLKTGSVFETKKLVKL